MFDLMEVEGYEFFRPLVTGWLSKIESALTCRARKKWKEVSEECHDEQTEVLTRTGWMLFSELTGDELLATVNLDADAIEYQKPTRLVRHKKFGEMVRFEGKALDALVTPGHRMVFFSPHGEVARFREASAINRSDQLKLTAAHWSGTTPSMPGFLGDTDPIDFAEWLGFYIAEGWCDKDRNVAVKAHYRVGIAQKKPAGRAYYEQLAKRIGLPAPRHSKRMDTYHFTNKELCAYLRQFGDNCYTKRVPQWVKDAPQSVIRAFLRGYIAGDGHRDKSGQTVTATASRQLADDIQELWLKIGRSASIRERAPAPYSITDPGRETRTGMSGKLYLVTAWTEGKRASLKRHTDGQIQLKYRTEQYDGMVYCATVPNGTLITRRNGKPLISGNCLMFYGRSAAAMWDPVYSKKFWKGVKSPRFRITINKAFEYVAVFGPNLIWDVPHRTVTSKKILELPQELFPDPQQYQAIQQQIASESVGDKVVGHLLDGWLNYTPKETGLEANNELAVLDAMLKGAGTLWPSLLTMPASERTLTQCRYEKPEDLIFDPDFTRANDCKWIALRHVQPYWEVERRFKLPTNSLKNKATLESSWHYNEMKGTENSGQERKAGKTSDLVVWYEIWSKLGCGARMTGMADSLKSHLEEVVGDYAYLAICPDCPYPLNCPADLIRGGADSGTIARQFEWPVPLWTDNRWPVERLVFYEDPESPYGLAPLAPALGELKAINAIVSWLVNRTWISSRQMWAVLAQYHDDMKKQLEDGEDLAIFSLPPGADDVKKVIQLFESKEVNRDAWEVLELLSNIFDKRMGMTPFVYGQNEGGTQDRTAETTNARKQAVGVRPEFMQKKVVEWQSRVASVEAILTWLYIRSSDVQPLLGNVGAMLWQRHIENADPELVMRQMRYEVAAASIRRPNRERDIQNLQEVMARFLPVAQNYGELSGDYTPVNGAMKQWADLHDMQNIEQLFIPAKDPNDPNAQLDQQLKQAEVQKTQAEAQKAMAEAQANPMAEMQFEQQMAEREAQVDLEKTKAELEMDMLRLQAELDAKKAELDLKVREGQIKLQQRQAEASLSLEVQKETGAQQVAAGNQQLRHSEQQHQQSMRQQAQQGAVKVATTKAQSDAKTSAIKQQAKARPSSKKS